MEPNNEIKQAILQGLIAQLEQSKYTNEVMGQTWQTIGNVQGAETCAKSLAENIKALSELNKKLEALCVE